jgi:hypothetical protein
MLMVRLVAAFFLLAPVAATAAERVQVRFVPLTAADAWDANTYRAIWQQDGTRIVAAFEAVTCLPFQESTVSAVVADDVSNSGGPEHPMLLRASYGRAAKQATLVHELGHRHLWQLAKRLDGIDGHMTLDLVLDRVWAYVWGRRFADERVRGESEWLATYDYASSWAWARGLAPVERTRLWNELLTRNGFAGDCRGSITAAASR